MGFTFIFDFMTEVLVVRRLFVLPEDRDLFLQVTGLLVELVWKCRIDLVFNSL